MDFETRMLKREIMRDMINVMISAIYKDGRNLVVPVIKYRCDIMDNIKIVETDKCKYIKVSKKSIDSEYKTFLFETNIRKSSVKVYKENYNSDNVYYIDHKKKGVIIPRKRTDLENRIVQMFDEVFENV